MGWARVPVQFKAIVQSIVEAQLENEHCLKQLLHPQSSSPQPCVLLVSILSCLALPLGMEAALDYWTWQSAASSRPITSRGLCGPNKVSSIHWSV